jgi:hypothetical protein
LINDVAARQESDRRPAAGDLARQHGGQAGRTGRLDHRLCPFEE